MQPPTLIARLDTAEDIGQGRVAYGPYTPFPRHSFALWAGDFRFAAELSLHGSLRNKTQWYGHSA